ncbi:MAG: ribokinase [Chloroflexi bacterium]|nr:ribokinase [Chloroflexota bacterium]
MPHPTKVRCLVLGGLNMDLVVRVEQLPRPGETVTGEDLLRAAGGKGGNQAVALARLGAEVSMVGRVGHDAFGRELARLLRDAGVSTRWVQGTDRPTGTALILVDSTGENSIAVAPGANQELLPEDVPRRAIEAADVLVAQLEVPVASVEEAFRLARLAAVRTVLNVAPARPLPAALLDLTDVLICNEVELSALLDRPVPAGSEATAAREVRRSANQVVAVTLGSRGALAIDRNEVVAQSAFAVQVVDSTGAGDAFVAGFVAGYRDGVQAALRLGGAAGSLACTRPGAQPSMPTLAEVQSLLNQR